MIIIEIAVRLIPEKKSPLANPPLFKTAFMPYNSLQYRDFEYPLKKKHNTFRIMVAGDSFSEGSYLSFEDRYPKKLEYYLNCCGNDNKISYEVINMSRGGRSTPQEVTMIKQQSGRLKPDLVILSYCLNDPEDWGEGADYLRKLWDKCYYRHFTKPPGWRCFFYDHSALVRLITHRLFNSRVNRGHTKYFHKLYRDAYPGWQKARTALLDLGKFSRSSHIPVRVVIFPMTPYGMGDDYPFTDIHNKIHAVLKEAGLPYIDLFPLFKYMDHSRLEHLRYINPHPSEIAQRMAAEALWQDLIGSGLLPTKIKLGAKPPYPHNPPF
ncbi:MAG: SGNH/GDSL hydrolase family protein [Candidatus Aureabacteria bacterium]|nr:SGNH/GDSL hydrolase family protein [Candidatus Auribacterota bacterium]